MEELFKANTWDIVLLKADLNAALFELTNNSKEFTCDAGSNIITNTNSVGIKRGMNIVAKDGNYELTFTQIKGTLTAFTKSDMCRLVLAIYQNVESDFAKFGVTVGLS